MHERRGLGHRPQHVARLHGVADRHLQAELPGAVTFDRRDLHAPADERLAEPLAVLLGERRQRSLHAVEDLAQQARPQLHLERRPGVLHLRAGLEARRLLVHLDHRLVAL